MADTYDPGKVVMTFGPIPIMGFAEGDMIMIEPLGPGDSLTIGSAGEPVRIKSRNRAHKVTAKLMDTHRINDALSLIYSAGNVAATLAVAVPGTSLLTGPERPRAFASPDAYLVQVPAVTYSDGVAVREWVWLCPVGTFVP